MTIPHRSRTRAPPPSIILRRRRRRRTTQHVQLDRMLATLHRIRDLWRAERRGWLWRLRRKRGVVRFQGSVCGVRAPLFISQALPHCVLRAPLPPSTLHPPGQTLQTPLCALQLPTPPPSLLSRPAPWTLALQLLSRPALRTLALQPDKPIPYLSERRVQDFKALGKLEWEAGYRREDSRNEKEKEEKEREKEEEEEEEDEPISPLTPTPPTHRTHLTQVNLRIVAPPASLFLPAAYYIATAVQSNQNHNYNNDTTNTTNNDNNDKGTLDPLRTPTNPFGSLVGMLDTAPAEEEKTPPLAYIPAAILQDATAEEGGVNGWSASRDEGTCVVSRRRRRGAVAEHCTVGIWAEVARLRERVERLEVRGAGQVGDGGGGGFGGGGEEGAGAGDEEGAEDSQMGRIGG